MRLTTMLTAFAMTWMLACHKGPVLKDKLGEVARVRVDVLHGHIQYFVEDPKDVAEILKGLDVGQHLEGGTRFGEREFPSMGLTFFDAQGVPHASLNFVDGVGSHNELLALDELASYLGEVHPADAKLVEQVIARAKPQ